VAVFLKERALRNEIEFHGHSVSPGRGLYLQPA
jgi:hypothetical protein